MMETFLSDIWNHPLTPKFITALVGLLAIYLISLLIRRYLRRYIEHNTSRYRLRKLVSFLAFLIALVFLASVFSDRLKGLGIILGITGAGIAFALQEVILSIAGWIAISLGSYFKTGDRIGWQGVVGDVIDLGVLTTTIMECGNWVHGDLYNGRIVKLPNSLIFKDPVYNYSGDFSFLWDEIRIPIQYGSDTQLAKNILTRIAEDTVGDYARRAEKEWEGLVRKFLIEKSQVQPMVSLTGDQNFLEFTLRYVVDYRFRRATKTDLFEKIFQEIKNTQGKILVAATAINILEFPPVKIQGLENLTKEKGSST